MDSKRKKLLENFLYFSDIAIVTYNLVKTLILAYIFFILYDFSLLMCLNSIYIEIISSFSITELYSINGGPANGWHDKIGWKAKTIWETQIINKSIYIKEKPGAKKMAPENCKENIIQIFLYR